MNQLQTIAAACQALRSLVRYETASICLPGSNMDQGDKDTRKIQDATRIYTETWIVPIIDAIERGDVAALKTITRSSQSAPIESMSSATKRVLIKRRDNLRDKEAEQDSLDNHDSKELADLLVLFPVPRPADGVHYPG